MQRGSEHPKGYILPLDEISPLYGFTWRQMGINAFANHRTQGITGFLGSTFLLRPIALISEDGKPIDPKSLAVSIAERFRGCPPIEIADRDLESARVAVCSRRGFATCLEKCWRKGQPCGGITR